jgi:site-specific DNA recombinase
VADLLGYVRLSEFGENLEDQQRDILADAQRRGDRIVAWFDDNDLAAGVASGADNSAPSVSKRGRGASASRYGRRKRRGYEAMMRHIRLGHFAGQPVDGFFGWHLDRVWRRPKELEELLDLADERGVVIRTCFGDYDIANAEHRAWLRFGVLINAKSSDDTSRRVKGDERGRAAAGLWHGGRVPYGWRRAEGGGLVLEPDEAATVRRIVRWIIKGDSVSAVVRRLNDGGVSGPAGRPWTRQNLTSVAKRWSNAAIREHTPRNVMGKPESPTAYHKAAWPAIVSVEQVERVRAILGAANRRTTPVGGGHTRSYLGTGFLVCGECGAHLKGKSRRDRRGGTVPAYVCAGCGKVSRKAELIDGLLGEVTVRRLSTAGAARPDTDTVEALRETRAAIAARQRDLTVRWARGALAQEAYDAGMAVLVEELADADRRLADARTDAPSMPADAATVKRRWEVATLSQRRAMIKSARFVIVATSVGRGRSGPAGLAVKLLDDA